MKAGHLHIINNYLNGLPPFTRYNILLTVVFLFYGYLCRLLNIYFFWESKTIGWTLFWLMAAALLLFRVKTKRAEKKGTALEKIGIGLSLFALLIKGVLFFGIPKTSAYNSALKFIDTNWYVRSYVGNVKGVFLVPYGALSMTTSADGEAGQADLHFIIKGSERYMDLNLLMEKDFTTDWIVEFQE